MRTHAIRWAPNGKWPAALLGLAALTSCTTLNEDLRRLFHQVELIDGICVANPQFETGDERIGVGAILSNGKMEQVRGSLRLQVAVLGSDGIVHPSPTPWTELPPDTIYPAAPRPGAYGYFRTPPLVRLPAGVQPVSVKIRVWMLLRNGPDIGVPCHERTFPEE